MVAAFRRKPRPVKRPLLDEVECNELVEVFGGSGLAARAPGCGLTHAARYLAVISSVEATNQENEKSFGAGRCGYERGTIQHVVRQLDEAIIGALCH